MSKQILFSVFQLCLDFCGKLLHIKEKHLDEWLPGIMRRYAHLLHNRVGISGNIIYFLIGLSGMIFREPYHSNHVIPSLAPIGIFLSKFLDIWLSK